MATQDPNPNTAKAWWGKAQEIGYPDPSRLDITAYEAHSASKFTEIDFTHLKAIWKNQSVGGFHIAEYVREEYVKRAEELMGLKQSPASEQGDPLSSPRRSGGRRG
jgi:hypothetical protein